MRLVFPNEVRIPNATGLTFDFSIVYDNEGLIPFGIAIAFGRIIFFGLYAPLGINYSGSGPRTIQFEQTDFPQGEQIRGF